MSVPAPIIALLNQLACPSCLGQLRADSAQILCTICRQSYPLTDGILVLIPQTAGESAQPEL